MLSPELGDELIGWATGDANEDDKSMECLRTSAYSTTGDTVVAALLASSTKSIERLRRSGGGGSAFVLLLLFVCGDAAVTACLIGLVLVIDDDLEEWRGRTSGGIDDDICRIGGLGGGDDSGDTAESRDFEMNRLLGDTFDGICCMDAVAVAVGLFELEENYCKNLAR